MVNLDYLKVGSYFVSHFVRSVQKHKDSAWGFHVWHINTVKINKKSILLNDIKYQKMRSTESHQAIMKPFLL